MFGSRKNLNPVDLLINIHSITDLARANWIYNTNISIIDTAPALILLCPTKK